MNDTVRKAIETALRYAEGDVEAARGQQVSLRARADDLEEVAVVAEKKVADLRAALEEMK